MILEYLFTTSDWLRVTARARSYNLGSMLSGTQLDPRGLFALSYYHPRPFERCLRFLPQGG